MLCCYEYSAARKLEPKYKEWSSAKRIHSMNNYNPQAVILKRKFHKRQQFIDNEINLIGSRFKGVNSPDFRDAELLAVIDK